jgi:hypothetical protein
MQRRRHKRPKNRRRCWHSTPKDCTTQAPCKIKPSTPCTAHALQPAERLNALTRTALDFVVQFVSELSNVSWYS